MRIVKDNRNLPKRYYRPEQEQCPHCQWKMKRRYTLWSKYVTTLEGRLHVLSQGYRCSNPECPEPQTFYRSAEAETLRPTAFTTAASRTWSPCRTFS
jgi:hypothetical protein